MIYVCDAIMGSGKSESAISFMNSHPEKKFIYISPYVLDGQRIQDGCPDRHFVLPTNIPDFSCSKTEHCKDLLSRGQNVACTHELFKRYDQSVLNIIREQHYTIIIDEEVNILEECLLHEDDLCLLQQSGYVNISDMGQISVTEKSYQGNVFRDIFYTLRNRNLESCTNDGESKFFYWQLPPDLLKAFDDVYILTYLFSGQGIKYMLDINRMAYQYIYIRRTFGGGYAFSDTPSYLPSYVSHISDMIDIYDGNNLNEIGTPKRNECPLSMHWFAKHHETRSDVLKKNLYNYFRWYTDVPADERMWGSFKNTTKRLTPKGLGRSHVVFNIRGSNEYRHKRALAYCVNIYLSPQVKNYYSKWGIAPDEDVYALSTMIQWIWRSAIRDGEKIHIYIPSERMRNLLKNWMAQIETDAVSGRWSQHGRRFENGDGAIVNQGEHTPLTEVLAS